MKGKVPPEAETLPRWARKQKTTKLHPGKLRRSVRQALMKRVLQRVKAKRVWHPQAWDLPYTRAQSPRRKAKKRFDLRRETDPHRVLDKSDDAACEALEELGFLWPWPGSACLACAPGRYGKTTDQ